MDRDRPDVLGPDDDDGYDDGYDDRYDDGHTRRSIAHAVLTPEALAVASLVLAGISLTGIGLLNGSAYLPPAFDEGAPERAVLVLTGLLGAALALLPVALGIWALRRLPEDSTSRTLAGAGVLLGCVSAVLRLVIAVRSATDDSLPFTQF